MTHRLICIYSALSLAAAIAEPYPDSPDELRKLILDRRPPPLTNLDVTARIHVKDFGAIPNDGKDDRKAVTAAIRKAKSLPGPVQINFEPGLYDFEPTTPDYQVNSAAAVLQLNQAQNLVIDGHGADILIHRQDISFSRVSNSTNIMIRNFSIDYDPLPFSQGTIEEINRDEASFVFKLHTGFPAPNDPFFKTCDSWGMLKDTTVPGRLKTGCPSFFSYKTITDLGEKRFQITLIKKDQISFFQENDAFVINGRSAGIGRYYKSENITFDHLTAYSCPSSLFSGSKTSRLNVLNCKGLLKGTRLITNGADGVHCQSARIGPWIENCEFQGLSDDCLNIYSVPVYILQQESSTRMKIRTQAPLKPGDKLVFFDPRAGRILCETSIKSCSENSLETADPVETLHIAPPGTPVDLRGWKNYDHAYNVSCIGNGFVYRNNYMHDGRRYGGFIKASYGLIENNRFEGLSRCALRVANEPGWPEGFWARNLLIQSNTVSECGYGNSDTPVVIVGEKLGGLLPAPFHRNIFITGNNIETLDGPAIECSGIDTLHIINNRLSGPDPESLIKIEHSENVYSTNNITPKGLEGKRRRQPEHGCRP